MPPPRGDPRRDASQAPGRQARDLPDGVGLERGQGAGLVPADRRDDDGDAAHPGQAGQLEPLARHPEDVEQPGRLEPVRPRGETTEPQRPAARGGADQLISHRPALGPRRGVQQDGPCRVAGCDQPTRWSPSLIEDSKSRSHEPIPALLSFHHLNPLDPAGRRRRLDLRQGVTVSQSIAVWTGAFRLKDPRSMRGGSGSAQFPASLISQPGQP